MASATSRDARGAIAARTLGSLVIRAVNAVAPAPIKVAKALARGVLFADRG
jgi:hypothetical protein